jgi:hypothetical protein
MIVDSLRVYKQPVFVYIPRGAELRGGAWVVVDPTINSDMMEMYADPESRGGVLEPEGTVQVKFRKAALEKLMCRLDKQMQEISTEMAAKDLSPEQKSDLTSRYNTRYAQLAPIYHQVAVKFADLHDTPGRMKKKDCISKIVPWTQSRRFFFWRLKRRLYEERLHALVRTADESLSRAIVSEKIQRWFTSAESGRRYLWEDDKAVAEWAEAEHEAWELTAKSPIASAISLLHQEHLGEKIKSLVSSSEDDVMNGVITLLDLCNPAQISRIRSLLDERGTLLKSTSSGSLNSLS